MVKKVLNGIIISKTVGKRLNRLLETFGLVLKILVLD
ncbi:hypothetical protein CoNPh11_CDS0089 [Staphylococcus phage S-CoN_Ph11]|nr:hypothetical protein CoNPh11_CDS0089 [Staphylococcus phage S-CoN_Ph11]